MEVAQSLHMHLAILEGQHIRNKNELLHAIAQEYAFPETPYPNWDGTQDWLSDISWLDYSGFLLLYTDIYYLFDEAPVDFAVLLDVLSDSTAYRAQRNIPFHVLLGPVVPEMARFIRTLRAAEHVQW
ncbi:MAG: barstar family protein [Chloroflexaceae bacterium]|nr:barstar family protein [Chloroflexaceae bacterium]